VVKLFRSLIWYNRTVSILTSICSATLTVSHFSFPESEYKPRVLYVILRNKSVGMGKTIQVAALIHTVKSLGNPPEGGPEVKPRMRQLAIDRAFKVTTDSRLRTTACRSTLVVAPTSLLSQWESELQRASAKGTLSTIVWHGANRAGLEVDIDGIDVLITSYGVLVSEHGRQERVNSHYRSPLFTSAFLDPDSPSLTDFYDLKRVGFVLVRVILRDANSNRLSV